MKIDERHLVQLAAVVKAGGVTEGISRIIAMLEKRLKNASPDPSSRNIERGNCKIDLVALQRGAQVANVAVALVDADIRTARLELGDHRRNQGIHEKRRAANRTRPLLPRRKLSIVSDALREADSMT